MRCSLACAPFTRAWWGPGPLLEPHPCSQSRKQVTHQPGGESLSLALLTSQGRNGTQQGEGFHSSSGFSLLPQTLQFKTYPAAIYLSFKCPEEGQAAMVGWAPILRQDEQEVIGLPGIYSRKQFPGRCRAFVYLVQSPGLPTHTHGLMGKENCKHNLFY